MSADQQTATEGISIIRILRCFASQKPTSCFHQNTKTIAHCNDIASKFNSRQSLLDCKLDFRGGVGGGVGGGGGGWRRGGVGGGGVQGWSLRQTQRILYARFEVQTAVAMTIAALQNEMTCNTVGIYRRV